PDKHFTGAGPDSELKAGGICGQFEPDLGNVASGPPAIFLFATEDGTISAWHPSIDPVHAILIIDNSATAAQYTGMAVANTNNGPVLYAANFRGGTIDVFDADFAPTTNQGGFVDPNLPAGFADDSQLGSLVQQPAMADRLLHPPPDSPNDMKLSQSRAATD